jgi:hypothetical protein
LDFREVVRGSVGDEFGLGMFVEVEEEIGGSWWR